MAWTYCTPGVVALMKSRRLSWLWQFALYSFLIFLAVRHCPEAFYFWQSPRCVIWKLSLFLFTQNWYKCYLDCLLCSLDYRCNLKYPYQTHMTPTWAWILCPSFWAKVTENFGKLPRIHQRPSQALDIGALGPLNSLKFVMDFLLKLASCANGWCFLFMFCRHIHKLSNLELLVSLRHSWHTLAVEDSSCVLGAWAF